MTNPEPIAFEPFSLTLSAFRASSTLMPLVTSRRLRGFFVPDGTPSRSSCAADR